MRLRWRLYIGLGGLLLFVLLVTIAAVWYLNRVNELERRITEDNFNSIQYCEQMREVLNSASDQSDYDVVFFSSASVGEFDRLLMKQESNVTEPGEAELTAELRIRISPILQSHRASREEVRSVEITLARLILTNTIAIERKNGISEATIDKAIRMLWVVCGLGFAAAILFIILFARSVERPVIARDKAKTGLMSTVSHELKTPVSSMKLSLKLLEDGRVGSLNPEQQELIRSLYSDTNRISEIISEVLNLTQMESGKITMNLQNVDPLVLVLKAMDAVRQLAISENVELRRHFPATSRPVFVDPEKTVWVLVNLLVNAIRHSPSGAAVDITGEDGHMFTVTVSDAGPGISEEDQKRIFEDYFMTQPLAHLKGTGLGLSISRQFLAAQNAEISVDSKLDAGSSFTVMLPRQT